MIAIVDYGLGNIRAFANVYKQLNLPCVIASNAEQLNSATKLILPGVGSFDEAMRLFGEHWAGKGEPLFQTDKSNFCSSWVNSTAIWRALPCLMALVSASWVIL